MKWDLLIKGGELLDPSQGIRRKLDVAFNAGRVLETGDDLDSAEARTMLDASGLLVTPGMIDLHVHVFPMVSYLGVDPDSTCLARGATTVVDAGSAGADTFDAFRNWVIDVSATDILAYLNIASTGMLSPEVGELMDLNHADVGKACKVIERHRDRILGVKVRLTRDLIVSESSGIAPLHRAREAADAAGLPIMVHPQDAYCESLDDVLAVMGKDDVLTHCFHAKEGCGILDSGGKVRASVRDAVERGVLLDVGHGRGSFGWNIVEAAIADDLSPHTISTDLHTLNVHGPVYDLGNVVSKFVFLGLSLEEAFAKVTSVPARFLRLEDQIGTLKPGARGDAVLFELRQGSFQLEDAYGDIRTGSQYLEPMAVVKNGTVYRQHR
jgi:dihydroorotase